MNRSGGYIKIGIVAMCVANITGCAFYRMKSEVKQLRHQQVLYGELAYPGEEQGSLLAVVYEKKGKRQRAAAYRTIPWTSKRFVFLLEPGDYRLAVFHDRDDDKIIDADEPVLLANNGAPLGFSEVSTRVDVQLSMPTTASPVPEGYDRDLRSKLAASREERYRISVGELADPEEERFSAAAGDTGQWRPHRFLRQYGMGVYMLAPYDEDKVPVLFVSGAGGHLGNWSYFLDELDQERYQAWYYSYPSGIRVERSAEVLHALTREMKVIYGFDNVIVVAHSLGGLVAREFVLRQLDEDYVDRLVTISTPWGGHEQAESGVSHLTSSLTAPVPSWHDVSSGSRFLQQLFYHKLSPQVPHHLVYAKKGAEDGDGIISLRSQCLREAMADAADTRGFNAGHVDVLSNPEVFRYVAGKLALAEPSGAPPFRDDFRTATVALGAPGDPPNPSGL